MTKALFNVCVHFESVEDFQEDLVRQAVEGVAESPAGPADDPMFPDNMSHTIDSIAFEEDIISRVRVELSGVGLTGEAASQVSKETINTMERAIKHIVEGEHYTTTYGGQCY